jgi:hypothetical protein
MNFMPGRPVRCIFLKNEKHATFRTWQKFEIKRFLYDVSPPVFRSGFDGVVVSMLASGTQDRRFKPGQSHRIFSGVKNPKHAFLRKGSKAVGPVS